ncbi:MAG: hypothetical protein HYS23_05930 [Geobacter sp.]|nr:hypothetical protein [Geobacter sp.]
MRLLTLARKSWIFFVASMVLCLAVPAVSRAETSLTFVQMEESKYVVKGEGLEGIAAINIIVDYDSTFPDAPQVNVMGGELLKKEGEAASTPGTLKLRILREDTKAGFEVCIYFQETGDYTAAINFVTAEVADLAGGTRPVPVEILPLPSPKEPESPSPQAEDRR